VVLAFALPAHAADSYPSPTQAVARMKVPEGFRVHLVAGEPTLIKPIAMTTDERGRLWVVESHSYPHWLKEKGPGKDRVLILEQQRDGRYSCKVFLDNGVNLSGIAVGFGGIWLTSVPKLIFIPVKEDRPAGKPIVHLDGFDLKARHNVVNTIAWGPDGWLYGLHGILTVARIGAPGTPANKRVPMDCGVWRYHPTRHTFEVVAWGTTNPWGLDWDDHGELFITNCVIKHLFHVVPGAHFVRMYGQDLNPHTYGLIESCADHLHWGGGDWTTSRGGKGSHSVAGGGHAHAGAMFYLGDNWPSTYRNRIFMANIHGNRLNQDRLERKGSGYIARHCEDFLLANDDWFRGLGLTLAADGSAFVSDWHDTGECHNYDKTHPSGRIYRICFGTPRMVQPDLARASDGELVRLQMHKNDWWVRQARRVLQERSSVGTLAADTSGAMRKHLNEERAVTRRMRALWALHVVGGADEKLLVDLLEDAEEHIRLWAVRLLVDDGKASRRTTDRLGEQARKEKSPAVRLALASALQKVPIAQRWTIAQNLSAWAEDAGDPYLPLMIWYGIEPAVSANPRQSAELLTRAKIPLVRRYIARRLATMAE
jgi:putative membrane-bound dehydrogenase-like protein